MNIHSASFILLKLVPCNHSASSNTFFPSFLFQALITAAVLEICSTTTGHLRRNGGRDGVTSEGNLFVCVLAAKASCTSLVTPGVPPLQTRLVVETLRAIGKVHNASEAGKQADMLPL